ncbi:TetR/AcrR family transcriptional regulator [Nocardia alni]|uniref:TetR/AcrR family transcriptional regulator n=1 Tax=Nocardia alni TaxID=2815723 RepID=UPI0027DF0660|nr:TetR/AcrR family transcriptional regulator [Nocardia alni]
MRHAESAGAQAPMSTEGSSFRRRLLDGVAEALRECGYPDMTIADVVRHARTSRRTFYEHFTGKEDAYVALMLEWNREAIAQIYAAVDLDAPWRTQVRQAVQAWIATSASDVAISHAWIRHSPALSGELFRRLHHDAATAYIDMIVNLTAAPAFQVADLHPPTRQVATILFGGFRELIASTIESGKEINDLVDVATETAIALIGPRDFGNGREK